MSAALSTWLSIASGKTPRGTQRALDELLAEHELSRLVMTVMDREAQRIADHRDFRPEIWARIVAFLGDFVHLCHRRKEDAVLLPALGPRLSAALEPVRRDHAAAELLTTELCDAVGEADWERVLRLSVTYAKRMRAHMRLEEGSELFAATARLPLGQDLVVRAGFQKVESEALGLRGRRAVLENLEALFAATGSSSMASVDQTAT